MIEIKNGKESKQVLSVSIRQWYIRVQQRSQFTPSIKFTVA